MAESFAEKAKSVHLNLYRLRNDNRDNMTQRERGREIDDAARATGKQIGQVRGRRVATERFDYELDCWVKV